MKKHLLLITLCLIVLGCSQPQDEPKYLLADSIVGEWVYDAPSEGRWEIMKFTQSGVFFYSNTDIFWGIKNNDNSGRYTINEDSSSILGMYFLNGTSMTLSMTVSEINDYCFSAKFQDTGLQFTYAKLLAKFMVKPNETVTPDYSSLVKAKITGYSSHKPAIATVDASTGVIKGVSSGKTYIDVITEDGTAVIEIVTFDENDMFDDYTYALAKTIDEVVGIMGDNYIHRDEISVRYLSDNYVVDTITFITGLKDETHVQFVEMSINDNVSRKQVLNSLGSKYSISADHSSDNVHIYVMDTFIERAPATIVYDEDRSIVYYSYLFYNEPWTDYWNLFGKDKAEIKAEMDKLGYVFALSNYSYSVNGSDYYYINDSERAFLVGFVFNSLDKMCEYWVYLNEDVKPQEVDNIIRLKYDFSQKESTDSQSVYYDTYQRFRVALNQDGTVVFNDIYQLPCEHPTWPDLTVGLGMTHEQIINEYNESCMLYENTNESITYIISNEFIGAIMFFFDPKSDYKYVYAAYASLNPTADKDKVLEILNSKYTAFPNGTLEDGSQYAWTNASDGVPATVGIIYYVTNGIIGYLKI